MSYAGFVYLFHKHERANKEYQRIIEEWNFYIYDNKNNPINNFKIIDLSNPEEPKILDYDLNNQKTFTQWQIKIMQEEVQKYYH
ncbi:hypothetical protein PG637_10025 [Riemerella anatipestifer]|nr:hypothetical protein [Riemerella anatipestifer]MDY3326003.1 hypothetical protein [Riemerella anatipestifer]MDY3352448.1 hypothetical protein [Riemerella anatipestifer]